MKCSKCGAEMVEGARYCMMCGAKKANVCPKCGTQLPDAARFCFKCGSEVREEGKSVLSGNTMDTLAQVKKEVEPEAVSRPTGMPVWDETPNGTCDCAVGECDCDGSIWN